VVGLLNELEERELVRRRRDRSDRRRHIRRAITTRRGRLHLAYAQLNLVENDFSATSEPRERRTLYDLLARAIGVISSPCDPADEHPPAQAIQHNPVCHRLGPEARG